MKLDKLYVGLVILSPTLAFATGNTTDVVTLFMLFLSIMAAGVQATVVGILLSMTLFRHQWLVIVSFIISISNLLFFLTATSSLTQFGQADLSVWIVIVVVLVVTPAFILMTFIMPTRQYKKQQRTHEL